MNKSALNISLRLEDHMDNFIYSPRVFLFFIILTSLLAPYQAIAQTPQKKPILIGSNKNFAPFEFLNKKGIAQGYTIDLIQSVAENQGLDIKIVLDTWSNTYHNLEEGKLDAVTGMMYSKERDVTFDFSVPHLIVPYALFKRKETLITSRNDLKHKKIITVSDVYAHEWLKKNNFTDTIIEVKTPTQALELLASGQHDCVVLPRLQGTNLLAELKINNVDTFGPPILEQKLCFAVAAGNSELLAELNKGLFSLQQSGEYDKIYLKWISVENNTNHYHKLLIYALASICVIIFALFVIGIWNRMLKRTVHLKTKAIRRKEETLNKIIQGIPIPTFVVDDKHIVTHWNRACELLTGQPAAKIIGTKDHPKALYDKHPYTIADLLLENVLTGKIQEHDNSVYIESPIMAGAYKTETLCSNAVVNNRWLNGTAALLKDETGSISGAIETWQDLTALKELERQLIQSQKMEALGTLAGGISHDYNNILSVIIGNADLIRSRLEKESPLSNNLDRIIAAAKRAQNLVQQILTYSRQAEIKPEPVQLRPVIEETLALVKISLPEDIIVIENIESNALVMVDASHIHQIAMNLLTNALYAMKDSGGVLTVSLKEKRVDKEKISHALCLIPGEFVKLTFRDTGHGIPLHIRDKILDPFFTTKTRGEGTGMGLSVTQGIVQQYNGIITFDSEPGKGTAFDVYLPKYVGHRRLPDPGS